MTRGANDEQEASDERFLHVLSRVLLLISATRAVQEWNDEDCLSSVMKETMRLELNVCKNVLSRCDHKKQVQLDKSIRR